MSRVEADQQDFGASEHETSRLLLSQAAAA